MLVVYVVVLVMHGHTDVRFSGEAFKMNCFGGITGDKLIVAQIIEKCTNYCGMKSSFL